MRSRRMARWASLASAGILLAGPWLLLHEAAEPAWLLGAAMAAFVLMALAWLYWVGVLIRAARKRRARRRAFARPIRR